MLECKNRRRQNLNFVSVNLVGVGVWEMLEYMRQSLNLVESCWSLDIRI